jgi:hypothetical protein
LFNGVKIIATGVFLVDQMDLSKLPERDRHQLMNILGEMACNALKLAQKTREDNDGYHTVGVPTKTSRQIKQGASISP